MSVCGLPLRAALPLRQRACYRRRGTPWPGARPWPRLETPIWLSVACSSANFEITNPHVLIGVGSNQTSKSPLQYSAAVSAGLGAHIETPRCQDFGPCQEAMAEVRAVGRERGGWSRAGGKGDQRSLSVFLLASLAGRTGLLISRILCSVTAPGAMWHTHSTFSREFRLISSFLLQVAVKTWLWLSSGLQATSTKSSRDKQKNSTQN